MHGPDHPHTLTARGNLALFLAAAGRTEEALGNLEELLADRLRVLGPDHPSTLSTRSNLALRTFRVGAGEARLSATSASY